MGYKIDYMRYMEEYSKISTLLLKLNESMNDIYSSMKELSSTPTIHSKSATVVKNYIKDIIINWTIPVIQFAISEFNQVFFLYIMEMHEIDDSIDARVYEDVLYKVEEQLRIKINETNDVIEEVSRTVQELSDITELTLPDTTDMEDILEETRVGVKRLRYNFYAYEERGLRNAKKLAENLEEMLIQIQKTAGELYEIEKYDGSGVKYEITEHVGNYSNLLKTGGYTEEGISRINEEGEQTYKEYIKVMEGINAQMAGVRIITGVVALLCPFTMGWGTGAIIVSTTVSGYSVIYNANETYKGEKEVELALNHDTETEAKGFIDTDSKVYHAFGKVSNIYTEILVSDAVLKGTVSSIKAGNLKTTKGTTLDNVDEVKEITQVNKIDDVCKNADVIETSYGKSSGNSGADNIADAARLKEYYKQAE